MFTKYYVTGGTGFLGRAVLNELKDKAGIRVLVPENEPAADLPPGVEAVRGDVRSESSLERFFEGADSRSCVIHMAGIVSIASEPDDRIFPVNVGGTRNVLRQCERRNTGRLIYVSSVHAIPERPKGTVMTEDTIFAPGLVSGPYAASKATATALVFKAAARGLDACVVFPSGIIGPEDPGTGSLSRMLRACLKGHLPFAVRGGYDFVDVRDAAAGIAACAERGTAGRGYILSGHYASVHEILSTARRTLSRKGPILVLPAGLARAAAPYAEKISLRRHVTPFFTPYAVQVLQSNALFSCAAAAADLGYAPRPLEETIRDTVLQLAKQQ